MKKAYSYLKENPDNYLERLYYNTKACIANDALTKHQLFLKFLHKYYNSGSIREQINMYSSVALSCCMVGKNDSAIYYIRQANPLIETNTVHNSKIIHYYLIKSFIYFNDSQFNVAE